MWLWLRSILAFGAAAIGGLAGFMGTGGMAGGFAWIILFGDKPWPAWSEPAIAAIALLGAAVTGTLFAVSAFRATS
jgi:hypothetical protein